MSSKIKLNNNQGDTITLEHSDTISSLGSRVIPLDNITHKVSTIAELRAMTERPEFVYASGYHTKNDGAFGSHFYRLATDTGQVDNGGTIIRTVNGVYELQYDGLLKAEWFGVKYDGTNEAALLHIAMAVGITEITSNIRVDSTYIVNGVDIPVVTFNGSINTGAGRTPVLDYSESQVVGNIHFNDTYWVGNSTRKHQLVAGVIRRNTASVDSSVVNANNWFFINDSTHIPLNIDFTKGDNAGTTQGGCELVDAGANLKIHYYGTKLNTLNITPDETFAKKGIRCGNSTGYDNAILTFVAPCSFTCDMNTLTVIDLDEDIWGLF